MLQIVPKWKFFIKWSLSQDLTIKGSPSLTSCYLTVDFFRVFLWACCFLWFIFCQVHAKSLWTRCNIWNANCPWFLPAYLKACLSCAKFQVILSETEPASSGVVSFFSPGGKRGGARPSKITSFDHFVHENAYFFLISLKAGGQNIFRGDNCPPAPAWPCYCLIG